MPIITSLLDTDLYKLNMLRVYFHHFPNADAEFVFKCRNENIVFTDKMVDQIREEIDHLCTLRFTSEEVNYIGSIPYHKDAVGFLEFLRMYQLNPMYIDIKNFGGHLSIRAKGPLFQVSMWEIYVLAIVQEVYWLNHFPHPDWKLGLDQLRKDIGEIKLTPQVMVTEFGTRRRFSKEYHEEVLKVLMKEMPAQLFGTSNVYFAMKYKLRPIGTMAHEYICLGQGLNTVPVADSQRYMLDVWSKEYDGNLGTVLSDTLGDDKFFKDFTLRFAKLYDGVRHDSGDPCIWGDNVIKHYQKLGVDPMSKYLMFSDSLTLAKAQKIWKYFEGRIKTSFGIGTTLTNNIPGVTPLNNVFKMVKAYGKPVAKLASDAGKAMCEDDEYLKYLRWAIK